MSGTEVTSIYFERSAAIGGRNRSKLLTAVDEIGRTRTTTYCEDRLATIGILDTSMESTNDGDKIIVDAVMDIFPSLHRAERFPTHRRLRKNEIDAAASCDSLILTGTNILRSKLRRDRQWPMGLAEFRAFRGRVIFLGVGWRRYEKNPNYFNRRLIAELSSKAIPVAARDEYTNQKLLQIGVNSVNTGCPTMWKLPETMATLGKVNECVFTLTDYNPNHKIDEAILRDLSARYRKVHIWPQSAADLTNIKRMRLPQNSNVVARGTASLDDTVKGRDYVGTRLHAGIRAAQNDCAVLVVAVDNRALEIGTDTGLPVTRRDAGLSSFQDAYDRSAAVTSTIKIQHAEIAQWKIDFNNAIEQQS